MALYDTTWYCNAGDQSTTGHYAVTKRPQNTAVAAGVVRRQFTAPAVGSERCFVCIVAGTTANVTDATWVLTRGAKTTDGTVTWQECTGQAGLNGDLTNTPTWATFKANTASNATLGAIIQRNNGASLQICTTAGAIGASEPAFSNTAGTTTTDSAAVWTSLGAPGGFTAGGCPFARLASACAVNWFAAGNTVYVGANHAESQTTLVNIGPSGNVSTIGKIICHNQSGSYPPAASDITTGAVIATTAAVNMVFTPGTTGVFYLNGLTFRPGVGQSTTSSFTLTASGCYFILENCTLELASTGTASALNVGSGSAGVVKFINTKVKFAATAQKVTLSVLQQFLWQNTGQVLVSGSSVPADFINVATGPVSAVLEALDLSQLTGNIVQALGQFAQIVIQDCKLNAAASVGVPTTTEAVVQLIRCDSGAVAYKSARYTYEGIETTDTGVTRVGGAVDPTGQAQSRRIATTANLQWLRPFKAGPFAVWNALTGANVTVTVCGIINDSVLPRNDDIWMEAEYLGSSASPLGAVVATTLATLLTTDAAVDSDGSSWTVPATAAFSEITAVNTALTNNFLTATHTSTATNSGVFGGTFSTTGKFYFELTVGATHGASDCVGAITSSGVLANMIGGTNCVEAYCLNGNIFSNGSNTSKTLGAIAPNDVIGVALDLTARLGWLRKNAGNWNGDPAANPATGVGGVTLYPTVGFTPAVAFGGASTAINDAMTLNSGGTAYANAAPSGFGNLPADTWTPFKLTTTLSSPQPGLAGYLHVRTKAAKPSAIYYIDPKITLS